MGPPDHPGFRGGIELLGHRHEGDIVGVEQFDELGKIGQGARQAVDLVDDDHVDFAGLHILEETLQGRAVGVAAGEVAVVVLAPQRRPPGLGLAADIGLRGLVLGVERVEILLKPLVGRDAGVDRTLTERLRATGQWPPC
jgi:hypothetical protein